MKIWGALVDILCEMDPHYQEYVVLEGSQKVLYMHITKAIYGLLVSAMLFCKKLVKDLQDYGFKLNPYDPCWVLLRHQSESQGQHWHRILPNWSDERRLHDQASSWKEIYRVQTRHHEPTNGRVIDDCHSLYCLRAIECFCYCGFHSQFMFTFAAQNRDCCCIDAVSLLGFGVQGKTYFHSSTNALMFQCEVLQVQTSNTLWHVICHQVLSTLLAVVLSEG